MPKTKKIGNMTLFVYTNKENRAFAIRESRRLKVKGG